MDHPQLDRRALLLAAAGSVLVAGCGLTARQAATPRSAPVPPARPIVRRQDPGTVVTDDEVAALVARLDAAVRRGDVRALRAVAPGIDVAEWRRRTTTLKRFPLTSVRFALDRTRGRAVNASGGAVDLTAYLVLTHRIEDCDATPVAQVYDARLTKPGKGAPLRISRLSGPTDGASPAPWDLGDYTVLQGDHVVLAATSADLPRARAGLSRIDAGVAQAMALIPPASGVSKIFVALADPDSHLFGRDRHAEYTGMTLRVGGGGSRVVLHPSAFGSPAELQRVALHESVHALAQQWGPDAQVWPTEGLAEWCENGFAVGLRASGTETALVRSGFAAFRRRMLGPRSDAVFRSRGEDANYACAAAVYAYLEERHGRSDALRFGRLCYQGSTDAAAHAVTGAPTRTLLARTERWVGRL